MKKFLGICLFIGNLLCANSVTLMNNSVFPLDVSIYSAGGDVLGQYSLKPQEQATWNNDNMLTNPTESQTPYTVIWTCQSGGQYGICSGITPGAEVFAAGCQGNLYCSPKKKTPPQGATPP